MYTFEYYYIRPYKIGNTANCYSVDRSWGYLAKWNKSEIKSQALYDFYPYVVYKTESNTCSIFKIIVSHLKYCKSIISGLSDSTLNTYFQDNSLTNIFKYKSITPFLWFKSPHDLFSSEKNPVFNMAFEVLHNIASFHVSYLFSHTFFTAAPATLNSLLFIDHLGILHFPLLDCSPPIYFRDCLHLDLCSLKSLHII